jgi:hypothetical protein
MNNLLPFIERFRFLAKDYSRCSGRHGARSWRGLAKATVLGRKIIQAKAFIITSPCLSERSEESQTREKDAASDTDEKEK